MSDRSCATCKWLKGDDCRSIVAGGPGRADIVRRLESGCPDGKWHEPKRSRHPKVEG